MVGESFLRQYGRALLEQGYPILPISPGYKYPRGLDDWQQTKANRAKLDKWLSGGFAEGGVGILTERFPAVDLDVRDQHVVDQLVGWCEENIGHTVQRVGAAPKTLLAYRTDEPFAKIASAKFIDMFDEEHKVEILGAGQQYVAFACHPDTGEPYRWTTQDTLADVPADDLPTITKTQAEDLIAYFESIIPPDWIVAERAPSSNDVDLSVPEAERALANTKPKIDISYDELDARLDAIDPDLSMREWVRVGMALYHQFDGDSDGFELWDRWSSGGHKYVEKEMAARWKSFSANLANTNPVTVATILYMTKDEAIEREKAPARGFQLIPASDVLAKLGPINWRIRGFLEENTTGLLFGDPGSFKSFIALDMLFHVAAGKDWHGHPVGQGPVIYIAGEGHGGLARRFAAWERHYGVNLAGLPFFVSTHAASFYDKGSAKAVVAAVQSIVDETGQTPAMIGIDTLARNFGAGDENSNTDMGTFLNHVDGLLRARFGATVLIVHHSGHSHKERARGATALKGGMDFEFRVEKTEHTFRAKVTCSKMKDAVEPDDVYFEGREVFVGNFDDDGDISSLVFERCEPPVVEEDHGLKGRQKALFEVIRQEQPVEKETLRTIVFADEMFTEQRQFRDTLRPLLDKGLVAENDKYLSIVEDFTDMENGESGENASN